VSRTQECALLVSLGPLNDNVLYLNKLNIIGNSGELSDLEYLPTKTGKVEYLQNMGMHTSGLLWPFKQHHNRFKQTQDHKKWWRID